MPRYSKLVALLALAATLSAPVVASARPADPRKSPSVGEQLPVLSDVDLAHLNAQTVLQRTPFPTGVKYQHVESLADGSLRVVVTTDSSAARAKTSALPASLESSLRQAAIGADVQVKVAAVSDTELDKAADAIFATRADWAGDLASLVNRVGPDHRNSAVIIGSRSASAELQRRAREHFDVPLIFVVAKTPVTRGRYDDSTPWKAGNALTATASHAGSEATCTQGFSWRRWSDGLTYASTAGHCYAINTSLFNGNKLQRIGYVAGRWYANEGPTDFELIRITVGSAGPKVWLGGKGTEDARFVAGADNVNGDANLDKTVCFSGANGGTNCGTITATHQRLEIGDLTGSHWTWGLTCVYLPNNHNFQGGDSGGPVLSTYSNGTAFAWGQAVAGWTDEDGDPIGGSCAGMFTPVQEISRTVGASVVVQS